MLDEELMLAVLVCLRLRVRAGLLAEVFHGVEHGALVVGPGRRINLLRLIVALGHIEWARLRHFRGRAVLLLLARVQRETAHTGR